MVDMKAIKVNRTTPVLTVQVKDTAFGLLSFTSTYESQYMSIYRYGMWILNDDFTVSNIVQEAFLKLWDYRETITSQEHAIKFLKQNVRWECHAYFRNPVSKFHRRFTYLDAIEDYDTVLGICEPEDEDERDEVTEKQLKVITDMIPFLPDSRQKSFLRLYYLDGLSYRQIATRLHITVAAASLDVKKGVDKLRSMIVRPQKLFSHTASSDTTDTSHRVWLYDIEGLSKEQSQIYRLRSECKYSFVKIADSLSLPQAYVQREYVAAWKVVSRQKKAKGCVVTATAHKSVSFLIA